jgi:hypothetical protein
VVNDESGGKDRTGITSTSVDLGDDLLDQTRTRTRTQTMPGTTQGAQPRREVVQDDLQSAKILYGEGLIDEAKRVLRKILIGDPGNAPAKQMLSEIHALELKQIFAGTSRRRRFSLPQKPDGQGIAEEELAGIDSEALIKGLDRDLGLGLFDEVPGLLQETLATAAKAEVEIEAGLGKSLQGASARDRLDIGICLLEIGMTRLALEQFLLAGEMLDKGREPELSLAAASLLAQAQLRCDLPHDAIETLQLALMESGMAQDRKIDLVYALGRAHEKLGRGPEAHGWYLRAASIDPTYRDVQESLIRTAGSSGPKP